MLDGLPTIGAPFRAVPKTLARLGGPPGDRLRRSWPQGLMPPGGLVFRGFGRLRSSPRVRQNAAEDAVRAGPSPVTARQPLTWTVTGGNGRRPAAKASRSGEPRNWAGQFTGPRGNAGSPHSAAASPRTGPGSPMVIPRGKTIAGSSTRIGVVRLTTTRVSRGMCLHRATPATALPAGTDAAPAPPAGAGWLAATRLPQAATVMIAPAAITSAAQSAAPSHGVRCTITLTSTLGGRSRARRPVQAYALDGSWARPVPLPCSARALGRRRPGGRGALREPGRASSADIGRAPGGTPRG